MAFYAFLVVFNERPAKEALSLFTRVAAGEFRGKRDEWRYAEAWAHYWVAFLSGRADTFQRWLDAMNLKPAKGFAARRLPLPDNPADPSERAGNVILYN